MLVLLAPEADELEVAIGNGRALGLALAAHLWSEGDVAGGRKPRVERIIALEHDPAIGARATDGPSADLDVAVSRPLEAGNHVEDGRLATAAGPKEAEEFPRLDVEVEMINRRVRGSLERPIHLLHIRKPNQWHVRNPLPPKLLYRPVPTVSMAIAPLRLIGARNVSMRTATVALASTYRRRRVGAQDLIGPCCCRQR